MTLYGNIFYNCWIALAAFSVHFFIAMQSPYATPRVLFGCFATAIIAFFAAYVIRYIISYVMYTPEIDNEQLANAQQLQEDELQMQEKNSTIEFNDENSEEIAEVVRTMLHTEQPAEAK
ncbi:MAG: hypothetical protein KIG60_02535 [Caryophanon sp.]|nr:hypothetical protein [Caryophanon sp.]